MLKTGREIWVGLGGDRINGRIFVSRSWHMWFGSPFFGIHMVFVGALFLSIFT